jgi:hypothetical protein
MGVLFFVDRISDGIVTMLYEEAEFSVTLPLSALPDGVKEGDWLRAMFEIDVAQKSRVRRDIDALMEELGGDI